MPVGSLHSYRGTYLEDGLGCVVGDEAVLEVAAHDTKALLGRPKEVKARECVNDESELGEHLEAVLKDPHEHYGNAGNGGSDDALGATVVIPPELEPPLDLLNNGED